MSHSVTIQTRTVTTGNPSAINVGFCRSWTGMLKLAQVALGIISVGLVGYVISHYSNYLYTESLFFILIATTFMISSFLLVLSCLCSYTTDSIISKTIFDLIFHAFAFALLLAASVTLLTKVTKGSSSYRSENDKLEMGAAVVGVVIMSLEVDAINEKYLSPGDTFLMLMATAFMIGTAIFIISYIFSPVSEAIIGKTNYEIIYNSFALFFILIASITVIAQESNREFGRRMIAAVLGIIDAILYAGNTALAVRNKI